MGTVISGEGQGQPVAPLQEGCLGTKHPSPTTHHLPNLLPVLSIGQTQVQAEGKGVVSVSPTGQPAGAQSSEEMEGEWI